MGLHLKVRPGEKLIVNGCLIQNGDRSSKIQIENRADVLRGSEILEGERCQTPVLRIQYQIQVALVSPDHRAVLVPEILDRLDEVSGIMSESVRLNIARTRGLVELGEFYAAFKKLTLVVEREKFLLSVDISDESTN
jgi:flagellar protein FlbT